MSTALSAGWPPLAWAARQVVILGRVFGMGVQDAMAYRVESAIWFMFDLVPPLVMLAVWLAAYRDTSDIGGYNVSAMLTYYIGVVALRALITTHQEYGINYQIRHGELANILVKPLNYWLYWLATEAAWKVMRLVLVTPVTLVLGLIFWRDLTSPAPGALLAAGLAAGLAFVLCFLLKQCLGYLSFWFIQLEGIEQTYALLSVLLSGELLPLDLLPPTWRALAERLPFAYLYYFPLQVALGRVTGADLWAGLATQLAWIVAAALLSVVLWRRGLRHFEGVGL